MDFCRRGVGCGCCGSAPAQAQQNDHVGWTIPAEEAKYWMMRRPEQFPDLGRLQRGMYAIPGHRADDAGAGGRRAGCATQAAVSLRPMAWSAATSRAYIVAQHVYEKPGGFSVYWAVKDDYRSKTLPISRQDRRHLR